MDLTGLHPPHLLNEDAIIVCCGDLILIDVRKLDKGRQVLVMKLIPDGRDGRASLTDVDAVPTLAQHVKTHASPPTPDQRQERFFLPGRKGSPQQLADPAIKIIDRMLAVNYRHPRNEGLLIGWPQLEERVLIFEVA